MIPASSRSTTTARQRAGAISLWIWHVKDGKENRLTLQSYATISNMQYHHAYMRKQFYIDNRPYTRDLISVLNGPLKNPKSAPQTQPTAAHHRP